MPPPLNLTYCLMPFIYLFIISFVLFPMFSHTNHDAGRKVRTPCTLQPLRDQNTVEFICLNMSQTLGDGDDGDAVFGFFFPICFFFFSCLLLRINKEMYVLRSIKTVCRDIVSAAAAATAATHGPLDENTPGQNPNRKTLSCVA